jgi:hypothetical protein
VREITSVFACSDDLVLEILKNVQANVAFLCDDMASVKAGITSMRTDGRDAYGVSRDRIISAAATSRVISNGLDV